MVPRRGGAGSSRSQTGFRSVESYGEQARASVREARLWSWAAGEWFRYTKKFETERCTPRVEWSFKQGHAVRRGVSWGCVTSHRFPDVAAIGVSARSSGADEGPRRA